MKQKVAKIFFELLRFELFEAELSVDVKSLITPSVLPALFTLSKRHDLAHIIGEALEKSNLLPKSSKIENLFLNERNLAFYRLANISYEYERVTSILENLKVDYLPLKGVLMRALYPQGWMRTSADIDILLSNSEVDKVVKEVVEKLNYTYQTTDAYNAIVISPNGVHVELHFDLIAKSDDSLSNKILSEVWENSTRVNNSRCHIMNEEYFYYYHVAHMARHFFKGGCGVKPFIDLWLLNNKVEYRAEKRRSLLQAGGLLKFERACYLLSKIWLENEAYTEETKVLEEFILNGGVFGNDKNEVLIKQGKKGGKFKYVLSRIFMPLEEMQHRYKTLKKHKWLYPFFVFIRCFEVLFKGDSKRIKNELKTSAQISNQKQQEIENLIDYLGLKK